MKKSTTILLLVAALSFGYLPTCTMNVEASNPTAVTDKDPKDHKTKKPHHKKPEPPHKVHHRKPEPPHKVHGHRPPRRPMPPVGTHYRERPQHCISISFNHAPYFFCRRYFLPLCQCKLRRGTPRNRHDCASLARNRRVPD